MVVEAGLRSGAANTAAWARALGRLVAAVPGPVTSSASAGCHVLLRNGAELVTRADDVIELVGRIGELAKAIPRVALVVGMGLRILQKRQELAEAVGSLAGAVERPSPHTSSDVMSFHGPWIWNLWKRSKNEPPQQLMLFEAG